MTDEIPAYALRAYSLFYARHGSREPFQQSELDWIVSQSMRKKIFSLLLKTGWIRKGSRKQYYCIDPKKAILGLLEFKFYKIIKTAEKQYVLTGLSAVEIWSDFSYVQRGIEKSPYFIKVLEKDIAYWKNFFSEERFPYFIEKGTTIGEYVILVPVKKIDFVEKDNLKVEKLETVAALVKKNKMYQYAYDYMREKYGTVAA